MARCLGGVRWINVLAWGDGLAPAGRVSACPPLSDEAADVFDCENPVAGVAPEHLAAQAKLKGAAL